MLESYLEDRYAKILGICSNTHKWMFLSGNANSGKSSMLKRLFQDSSDCIKIFQGGCDVDVRKRMIENMLHDIKNFSDSEKVFYIFLDEFDDEESIELMINNLKDKNVKVVISTKKSESCFEKYNDWFDVYTLCCQELVKYINQYMNLDINKYSSLLEFETGDWIEMYRMFNEEETIELLINRVIDIKSKRLREKNETKQSLNVLDTPIENQIRMYRFK